MVVHSSGSGSDFAARKVDVGASQQRGISAGADLGIVGHWPTEDKTRAVLAAIQPHSAGFQPGVRGPMFGVAKRSTREAGCESGSSENNNPYSDTGL